MTSNASAFSAALLVLITATSAFANQNADIAAINAYRADALSHSLRTNSDYYRIMSDAGQVNAIAQRLSREQPFNAPVYSYAVSVSQELSLRVQSGASR